MEVHVWKMLKNVVAVVISYMMDQLERANRQPATYETYWTLYETPKDRLHKEVKSAEEQCILYVPYTDLQSSDSYGLHQDRR